MTALQTIAVAFAMFSALPMPQFAWNEKNMRYALCAFPLIGVVIGALWCLCGALPLPDFARAAGFCLMPVWVTGGIVQFTQSDYFAAHTTGTLITDDTAYNIALFACVRADAYDPVLYDPAQSPDALLAYIKAHAVQYRTPGSGPVVAFSTCTEAATNGRVLLFGQLLPQT